MPWHTTKETSSTVEKCVKYPHLQGFSTVLVGGYSTFLSYKARNDWMEYARGLKEYLDYLTAEQRLLSIQYQQNGSSADLSWAMVARERSFFNAEATMFNIAKAWTSGMLSSEDVDTGLPVTPVSP